MPRTGRPPERHGCLVADCTAKHCARGWCALHYSRWLRTGTTEPRLRVPAHRYPSRDKEYVRAPRPWSSRSAEMKEHKRLHNLKRHRKGYMRPKLQEAKSYVNSIRATTACADCNLFFPPVCMDFDHVRGVKVNDVGHLVASGRPIEELTAEIAKCDLVCSNCHRIRTAERHTLRKANAAQCLISS